MKEVDVNEHTIESSRTEERRNGYRSRRNFKRRKRPFVVEIIYMDSTSEEKSKPCYKTTASAGCDINAINDFTIPARGTALQVKTGIKIKIPYGFEGQLRPRSGLSTKGLTIINSPGTIDADYRGEIMINFANLSEQEINIKSGEAMAQIIFSPVKHAIFKSVDEFTPDRVNNRGEGGFGSTDNKPTTTETPEA